MGQQSRRHHFIPQFFLKQWAASDGRVCEYSRPYGKLVARRKHPKAVGFEIGLYDLPGAVPEDVAFLEDRFFAHGDQRASDAVCKMAAGKVSLVTHQQREAFTRLLISFHHRTPERVAAIREAMVEELEPILERLHRDLVAGTKGPLPWGMTFEQFATNQRREVREYTWGPLLMRLVDSDLVGPAIFNMRWVLRRLPRSEHDLLLGDHPLIGSNGLLQPTGHIAVPIGPRLLFLAAQNKNTITAICKQPDNRIVRDANRETLRHAKRFVYGSGEQHFAFVERRLGRTGWLPP